MSDGSKSQPRSFQDDLNLIQECPVCEKEYKIDKVKVLEKKKGAHLIHITCPDCSSAVLAIVLMTGVGASSIGMLTDLKPKDVLKIKNHDPFSHDEILDFYQTLRKSNNFESAILTEVKNNIN